MWNPIATMLIERDSTERVCRITAKLFVKFSYVLRESGSQKNWERGTPMASASAAISSASFRRSSAFHPPEKTNIPPCNLLAREAARARGRCHRVMPSTTVKSLLISQSSRNRKSVTWSMAKHAPNIGSLMSSETVDVSFLETFSAEPLTRPKQRQTTG